MADITTYTITHDCRYVCMVNVYLMFCLCSINPKLSANRWYL